MSESLYRHHFVKQAQDSLLRQEQAHQILRQSNSTKTTQKSNQILTQKLFNALEQFPDEELISVKQSLPILYSLGILQVLKSVDEVKTILNTEQKPTNSYRLKAEAKFISHLWKTIGSESIVCLELKKIIYLFHLKKGATLKQILNQMFDSELAANQLYASWNQLQNGRLYYRQPHGRQKLKTQEDLGSTCTWSQQKKFEKIKSYSNNKIILNNQSKDKPAQQKKHKELGKSKFNSTVRNYHAGNNYHSKGNKQNQPIFDRLYQTQFYSKKELLKDEHQKEKQKQELLQCTFKPQINQTRMLERSRSSSLNKTMEVKGYDKAISRLKQAHKRQAQDKEKSEHIPTGENYEQLRKKSLNPPSFLSRKKEGAGEHLFSIGLEIGNRKTVLKIREGDTAESAGAKICQIYGLNSRFQADLQELIQKQLDNFWRHH